MENTAALALIIHQHCQPLQLLESITSGAFSIEASPACQDGLASSEVLIGFRKTDGSEDRNVNLFCEFHEGDVVAMGLIERIIVVRMLKYVIRIKGLCF